MQALLPTATQLILEELPVEKLTQELQQKKAARIAKSGAPTGAAIPVGSASEASTATGITAPGGKDDDAQSVQSFASESYVMAQREGEEKPAKKSRVKLWDEIKISCKVFAKVLLPFSSHKLMGLGAIQLYHGPSLCCTPLLSLVY